MNNLLELPARPQSEAVINTRDHLQNAVRDRCRQYKKALRSCRKRFEQRSVHALRVETRRLLALITLVQSCIPGFSVRRSEKRLKRLFTRLAALRDVHVQINFFQRERRAHADVAGICDDLHDQEKRLVKRLQIQFKKRRCHKILKAVQTVRRRARSRLVEADLQRVSRTSVAVIDDAFARMMALRARSGALDPPIIHRARVAFKRFRYLVEIMQPVLPDVSRRHVEDMQTLQTLMGEIQDIEVFQKAIDEFVEEHPTLRRQGYARRCRATRGWSPQRLRAGLNRRHSRLISKYAEGADALLAFWRAENQI